MAKSVHQRIWDSFPDNPDVDPKVYGERIFSSWKDVSSSLSRSVVLILGLIALFELLAYQNSSHDFTIGPLSFTNTSTVQVFLPTIIAYVIYDGCHLTIRWMDLQAAYAAIIEKSYPAISENDLDLLVAPVLPAFWAVGRRLSAQNSDRAERFILPVKVSLAAITAIVLSGFEIQAYCHLFDRFGLRDILLWANTGVTILFLSCTIIYVALSSD